MQLLRAIRGARSQIAFARRLGYRRNPICDWEHGRRFPTAVETLRATRIAGLDLDRAFRGFATLEAPPPSGYDAEALAAWLGRLRGKTPIGEVAARAGVSRFAASRWLSGATQPRLPDFLRLVDALTRRLSDWVAALVPIENVPALAADFARRQDGRRLAVEVPWSEAVVRLLETAEYQGSPHRPGWLAERLGVDPISLSRADLERLRELHLGYFREVRALVAASEPVEVAALVNVQLITFATR